MYRSILVALLVTMMATPAQAYDPCHGLELCIDFAITSDERLQVVPDARDPVAVAHWFHVTARDQDSNLTVGFDIVVLDDDQFYCAAFNGWEFTCELQMAVPVGVPDDDYSSCLAKGEYSVSFGGEQLAHGMGLVPAKC